MFISDFVRSHYKEFTDSNAGTCITNLTSHYRLEKKLLTKDAVVF